MVDSLSLFSPGSFQGYGASSLAGAGGQTAAAQSLAADSRGVAGGEAAQSQQQQQAQSGFGTRGQSGGQSGGTAGAGTGSGVATGGGRLAGATLLTAQEQGQQSGGEATAAGELSEEEQAQVAKLKQIDAKVRAHERAHAAVGGAHAGAPSYSYTRGPDGQLYATGGEVAIDISAEQDPEATLQKATQIAAAALAPADPSGQDRAVAAAAAQLRLQALAQIRQEKRAEQEQQAADRAADAAEAEQARQSPGGEAAPAGTAGGDAAAPAQARIAAAGNRIGQLVGLIA